MMIPHLILVYLLPLAAIWGMIGLRRNIRERRALRRHREAEAAGMTEPASLHPAIDPAFCIGCGACVSTCPEGDILGLVRGKARLLEPTRCIGHGACAAACPVHGIELVFGTEKRGMDIPEVGPDFQTNVPGIYIAGELGGMGLIRNAVEQGRQAMAEIAKRPKAGGGLDVVIIGAGPAGISASLGAQAAGLKAKTVEQDSLGGTVSHFPRGKLVMTAPAELPIFGKMSFRETSKETLLDFWQKVIADTGVQIGFGERVEAITPAGGGFVVKTTKGEYATGAVLLCIGRRGTPRKLGVPGEEQSKVVYRLIDAEQYRGRHVLVVGGGDSALEAATSIAEVEGSTVTLSYRSGGFSRAKAKNRDKVAEMQADGRLRVLLNSNVRRIGAAEVEIEQEGETITAPNDAVIVCAGGILPTGFLKSFGVNVETKHGVA